MSARNPHGPDPMTVRPVTSGSGDLPEMERLAREAFPPEEYMAPSVLLELAQQGILDVWGLYVRDRFAGYMAVRPYRQMAYLFFLAVSPEGRGQGRGGQALALLDTLYPGRQFAVDFELPEEDAPNQAQRLARRRFYLRNGFLETGQCLAYRGVDYEIFCRPGPLDLREFQDMAAGILVEGFAPSYFRRPDLPDSRRDGDWT